MSNIYQFNVGGTTYDLAGMGLIAPVQITLTASQLYNEGDQFIYQGLLYEATATIASGTAITIGSNCQLADVVTKQIAQINSDLCDDVTIASATGSNTYTTKLAYLKTYFDALTSKQKRFSSLNMGGYKYECISAYYKVFSRTVIGSLGDSYSVETIYLDSGNYYRAVTTAGATTFTDASSSTTSQNIELRTLFKS